MTVRGRRLRARPRRSKLARPWGRESIMSAIADDTKPAATKADADTLLREQSFAQNLFFGEILEENLFPYPKMREKDREVLGMMVDAIDQYLADKHKDF